MKFKVGILGCGFVSQLYGSTAHNHTDTFEIGGCHDLIADRARRFSQRYGCFVYDSLDQMLTDPEIQLVVNLTTARDHYELNQRVLNHGKHLYCEKPLSMTLPEAKHLESLAQEQGLVIGSAPCNMLAEAFLAVAKLVATEQIGRVRLLRLNLLGPRVDLLGVPGHENSSGVPWPGESEFNDVGCAREHSGYLVALGVALFGSVKTVKSIGSLVVPQRNIGGGMLTIENDDLHLALLEFENGVIGTLVVGDVGDTPEPFLEIIGDNGKIRWDDVWDYHSTVRLYQGLICDRESEKVVDFEQAGFVHEYVFNMDYCRGISNVLQSLNKAAPQAYPLGQQIHVTEITELIARQGVNSPATSTEPTPVTTLEAALKAAMETSQVIRWGILGTGWIARQYATTFPSVVSCELTGVGSRSLASSCAFAREFALPHAFGTYDELIHDPHVDVVYIALPTALHEEFTIKAVRAKKHVVCEKPLSKDLASVQRMFQAAKEEGVYLCDGIQWIHAPYSRWDVMSIGDAEEAHGPLLSIDVKFLVPGEFIHENNIRFDSTLEPQGVIGDLAIYPVSLAAFVTGFQAPINCECQWRPRRCCGTVTWETMKLDFDVSYEAIEFKQLATFRFSDGAVKEWTSPFFRGDGRRQRADLVHNMNNAIRFGPELGKWYRSPIGFSERYNLLFQSILDGLFANRTAMA